MRRQSIRFPPWFWEGLSLKFGGKVYITSFHDTTWPFDQLKTILLGQAQRSLPYHITDAEKRGPHAPYIERPEKAPVGT